MSITISPSPEEEKGVRDRAARAGQDVAAYVRQTIHREILGASEALAPFRYEVAILRAGAAATFSLGGRAAVRASFQ
jgi:hypothetical protein